METYNNDNSTKKRNKNNANGIAKYLNVIYF